MVRRMTAGSDSFTDAVTALTSVQVRPEFVLREAPAPARLAPSTVAVTVEMADPDSDLASGRFVLLHDPDGVDEWGGSFRAVVFVRAELESYLVDDVLLPDVAWSWVEEALAVRGCHSVHLGGTITRSSSRSFGSMSDRPGDGHVEIRASWTPSESEASNLVDSMDQHAGAWLDLVAHAAGMPPLPEGVAMVNGHQRRARG